MWKLIYVFSPWSVANPERPINLENSPPSPNVNVFKEFVLLFVAFSWHDLMWFECFHLVFIWLPTHMCAILKRIRRSGRWCYLVIDGYIVLNQVKYHEPGVTSIKLVEFLFAEICVAKCWQFLISQSQFFGVNLKTFKDKTTLELFLNIL